METNDLFDVSQTQPETALIQEESEKSLQENVGKSDKPSSAEQSEQCSDNEGETIEGFESTMSNQEAESEITKSPQQIFSNADVESKLQEALKPISGSQDSLKELEQQLFEDVRTCSSPGTQITHRLVASKRSETEENIVELDMNVTEPHHPCKGTPVPKSDPNLDTRFSCISEETLLEETGVNSDLVGDTSVSEQSSKDGTLDIELTKKPTNVQKETSLLGYFVAELTRGHLLETEEDRYAERRQKVYTFMKTPRELEKLMTFGFFLCLDCFLFVFTYLPLRVMIALFKLLSGIIMWTKRSRLLEPAEICDLLKGAILLVCYIALSYIDFSVLYHLVRGQSVIKLYVVYNMLDIADKLFSSFGQDTLDALFWTATEPRGRKREHFGTLPHFVLSAVYVLLHAGLVLFQAITLNVAINSHNKALLTIMVSNQFVELKGSVFKKFEKNNLFQMSCADIRERFYYVILILIVTLRNLTEFNWDIGHMYVLLPDIFMLVISEFFVDWIKHAFITKFNDIPSEVYRDFRAHLAHDMTSSRLCVKARTDHFDLVSRKMGFIPLPLACLLFRVFRQSVKLQGVSGVVLAVVAYSWLISLKVLNSIFLLGKACKYVAEEEEREQERKQAELVSSLSSQSSEILGAGSTISLLNRKSLFDSKITKKTDKGESKGTDDPQRKRAKTLAEIDRFTLVTNQIA